LAQLAFHLHYLPSFAKELFGSPKSLLHLSSHIPRSKVDPGRPSGASRHWRLLCFGFRYVNGVAICIKPFSGLYQAAGSAFFPTVYVIPCVRLNCVVQRVQQKKTPLLHSSNTRYGWVVSPCPMQSFFALEMPSFSWRTNVKADGTSIARSNPAVCVRPAWA